MPPPSLRLPILDSKTAELQRAFDLFNQVSAELTSAYGALQNRVASLTEELAVANGELLVPVPGRSPVGAFVAARRPAGRRPWCWTAAPGHPDPAGGPRPVRRGGGGQPLGRQGLRPLLEPTLAVGASGWWASAA